MRILIAEDDSILADGLVRSLRQSGYAVDHVRSGVDADTALSMQSFDLLILDLGLPKMPGLEVLRRLRARNSNLPVLILTAADSVDERVKGLDLGADDYMAKPFALNELEARVRALTRRARTQESTLISVGDLQVDLISRRATRDGVRLDLTAKEFQLLSVLARRRGEILSKTLITELVWDVNFESNANVVETAIKRLRAKLDGPHAAKLLHTIRGMGYVLEVREEGGQTS